MNSPNNKKTILVTGGAGFIGSHLCEKLLDQGHEVICLDNFFTGSKDNVKHLLGNPYFELVRHDVVFPYFVEIDEIYHLACPASPQHYQFNPVKTLKTSVMGSINMLGLAKRTKAKVLLASTSEVYGDPEISPQHEDYRGSVNPIGIRACYDEGKRCAETLFFDYHREHNVRIKVARIFNTYGPRMAINDGRVVSNFICQALEKKPITVYGDGSQTRSFCYVSDLVDGLIKLMNSPEDVVGPINLGNPNEISILELVQQVLTETKQNMDITHLPLPADDPKQRRPDINKAKSLLDWEPKIPLTEGLKNAIPHFRDKLNSVSDS